MASKVYTPYTRRALLAMGDLSLALGRSLARSEYAPPGRLWQESARKAGFWLIKSVDAYQRAGLGRQAAVVGRYLERLRRAYFEAGGT